jgi:hypothetical protein
MSSTSLKVAAALAGVAAVAALVRSFTRPKAGKLAGTTVDVAPPLVGKRAGGGTLTPAEVTRLLDVIERDIVPLTTAGVAVVRPHVCDTCAHVCACACAWSGKGGGRSKFMHCSFHVRRAKQPQRGPACPHTTGRTHCNRIIV